MFHHPDCAYFTADEGETSWPERCPLGIRSQYLKFAEERTQPCRDLAARIALENPRARSSTSGCGPGNSTEVLAARWPGAEIAGLDSSAAMIAQARSLASRWQLAARRYRGLGRRRGSLRPRLLQRRAAMGARPRPGLSLDSWRGSRAGGALAVQMPGNWEAEAHRLMRASRHGFRPRTSVREWFTHGPNSTMTR